MLLLQKELKQYDLQLTNAPKGYKLKDKLTGNEALFLSLEDVQAYVNSYYKG